MNRESVALGVAVLAAILIYAGVIYGAYLVTSPKVSVKVEEYILSINQNATTARIGESIRFWGTFTKNGEPTLGENVELHYGNGTSTGLSDITIVGGAYTIIWTATQQGTFEFYTQVALEP